MKLVIRKTDKSELFQTENITREAFWNLYTPGCNEHLVLHQLRESNSYIEGLDFLTIYNEEIVGHIISTLAQVVGNNGEEHVVLCVGPVSVLPSFQNKGIGSGLINYSISEAREMGFKGMILFGNPDYYQRFGFKNAKDYQITTKDNQNFDPFMALELVENGLESVSGRFFEDEAFITIDEDLFEFEMHFPLKEKGNPKITIPIIK